MSDWRLFIDDDRVPEQVYESNGGWTVARSMESVQELCEQLGPPSAVSFDHDMGDDASSGHEIAEWLIDRNLLPDDWRVHSANPVGARKIRQVCRDGVTSAKAREAFEP